MHPVNRLRLRFDGEAGNRRGGHQLTEDAPSGTAEAARRGLAATMADIAALAGVTKMTVSRALRQPDKVRPETRERVRAAALSVGYIPNRTAGSLTARSSGLVGAVVPTLRHSLFAETLEGISDVLATAGIDLIVANSRYQTGAEEAQIRALLGRRPDAIVLTGLTHTRAARDLLQSAGIAIVETWESADQPIDMAVGFSNRDAAHAMTALLAGAGYRRIVFVNGPSGGNERARHRSEGYRAAMSSAGLQASPVRILRDVGAIQPETGARILRKLVTERPDIDAVFFTSDVYAVGAILECRRLGLAVPDRIGIAGFHDLELGRVVTPSLTTVHVPAQEIGRVAGRMILGRLKGEEPSALRQELPFKLVVRESTRRSPPAGVIDP
jgi:LacI family gluconate utilization system Gnt-I transcriptional repressor